MTPSKNVNYPMIEKWLPNIGFEYPFGFAIGMQETKGLPYVSAIKLEAELAKGVRVFCIRKDSTDFSTKQFDMDKYESLILPPQPIKPQKVEFEVEWGNTPDHIWKDVASKFSDRKVKVTIEEIK